MSISLFVTLILTLYGMFEIKAETTQGLQLTHAHVCSKTVKYEDHEVYYVRHKCTLKDVLAEVLKVNKQCTFKNKYITKKKHRTVYRYKKIYVCCHGYIRKGHKCVKGKKTTLHTPTVTEPTSLETTPIPTKTTPTNNTHRSTKMTVETTTFNVKTTQGKSTFITRKTSYKVTNKTTEIPNTTSRMNETTTQKDMKRTVIPIIVVILIVVTVVVVVLACLLCVVCCCKIYGKRKKNCGRSEKEKHKFESESFETIAYNRNQHGYGSINEKVQNNQSACEISTNEKPVGKHLYPDLTLHDNIKRRENYVH